MKTTHLISAIALVTGSVFAGTMPTTKMVPVDHIYSPIGFDSNDNTEVVLTGFLPNLCYKAQKADVNVDGTKVNVNMKALKYETTGYCVEMIVPFVESVGLGILDKGKYDITVNGNTSLEKKGAIQVAEATSDAIDDFVYANVEYVERVEGTRKVLLKGHNPSDCFQKEEVKLVSNGADTFSVLPKMKQVSSFCPRKMVSFEWEVEVPNTVNADDVLLHVRCMDGKSVNAIFKNTEI